MDAQTRTQRDPGRPASGVWRRPRAPPGQRAAWAVRGGRRRQQAVDPGPKGRPSLPTNSNAAGGENSSDLTVKPSRVLGTGVRACVRKTAREQDPEPMALEDRAGTEQSRHGRLGLARAGQATQAAASPGEAGPPHVRLGPAVSPTCSSAPGSDGRHSPGFAQRGFSTERRILTFVRTHLLDPGERVRLHQRVRDADHVHPVQHALRATGRLGPGPPRGPTAAVRLSRRAAPRTPGRGPRRARGPRARHSPSALRATGLRPF